MKAAGAPSDAPACRIPRERASAARPSPSLRGGEQSVDDVLEGRVRLRPHDLGSLDLRTVRLDHADEERGRAGGLDPLGFSDVLADPGLVLAAVDALVE